MGGEIFEIRKNERPLFVANAGDNVEVDTVNSMGFLPPVDFDDPLQNNMSKSNNSGGISTKRSGANSNTYDGKFHNTNRK
jgi:hypothetical protein